MLGILGSGASSFLGTGDAVADAAGLQHYVDLWDQRHRLVAPTEKSRTIVLGDDDWPFPVPLVKGKSGWTFDAKAGEDEIITRRVGQNELDAIQVCLGYFNAQRDYRARNPDGAAVAHYADRLISSPGKRDGLYWPTEKGEPESPGGPGRAPGRRATRSPSLRPTAGTATGSLPPRVPEPRAERATTRSMASWWMASRWWHTRRRTRHRA